MIIFLRIVWIYGGAMGLDDLKISFVMWILWNHHLGSWTVLQLKVLVDGDYFDGEVVNVAWWDNLSYTAYQPSPHMRTFNLVAEGGLEFLDLLQRILEHAFSSTNFSHLEVGMEFDSKYVFVTTVKWYSIQLGVNFIVACSWSEK